MHELDESSAYFNTWRHPPQGCKAVHKPRKGRNMSQLTFQMDSKTEAILSQLMELLGSPSKASALRSAVALAGVVAPEIQDDTLIIHDQKEDQDVKIRILGLQQ